jgi:hypothetical protein
MLNEEVRPTASYVPSASVPSAYTVPACGIIGTARITMTTATIMAMIRLKFDLINKTLLKINNKGNKNAPFPEGGYAT